MATDEDIANFLAHYGVPGMKWGRRKSPDAPRGKVKRAATKANTALNAGAKVIDRGEKKLIFLPREKRDQAASRTQTQVLGAARRINKDPQFKGKDLKKDPKLKAEYSKRVEKEAVKIYAEHLSIARTEAVLDALTAITAPRGDRMTIQADKDLIQHAEQETLVSFALVRDSLDHIVDMSVVKDELEQSDSVSNFLAHYGVPGMKWGVRKSAGSRSEKRVEKATQRKAKSAERLENSRKVTPKSTDRAVRLTAEGGKKREAHEDAIKARVAKQVAKKSTTNALSNQELKDLVTRMNLEQQYRTLSAAERKDKDRRQKELDDEISKWVDLATKI